MRTRVRRSASLRGMLALAVLAGAAAWPAGRARASTELELGAPAPSCVVGLVATGAITLEGPWALSRPQGLAVDHRQRVLVADTGNHRVVEMSPSGTPVGEFGGYGWEEARFDSPVDLAVYAGFYIYVLDGGNRRVQRFDVDGNYLDTVVQTGDAGTPVALEVGRAGEIYLLDADSQSVLFLSQFGEAENAFGRFGSEGGGLTIPFDIAAGPAGEVAVADLGRAAVFVFDQFGALSLTVSSPDTLLACGVAFDRRGNLLVSDRIHGRVSVFSPAGACTAVLDRDAAGNAIHPSALAVTARDELLVLEREPARILRAEMRYGDCAAPR